MTPKIGRLSDAARVSYLLAPSAVLLVVIIAIPTVSAMYGSLFSDPLIGAPRFIGIANYIEALTSSEFWAAVQVTVLFAAASVILETAIGLGLALIMHHAITGRSLIRATVLAPWTIPSAIAAVLWSWMLQPSGIINHLLGTEVLWTGEEWASKCAILMIDVWKTSPFVALLLLSGLQTIPEELYLAAKIDGAGPWQCFTRITLPMLRPALLIAVLFRALDALRIYDIPAILTGGANDTTTISVLVVRAITNDLRTNYGSALSTITFVILFSVSLALIRLLMPQRLLLESD
jgi:ABC-type sugar transport system permease subunit